MDNVILLLFKHRIDSFIHGNILIFGFDTNSLITSIYYYEYSYDHLGRQTEKAFLCLPMILKNSTLIQL